MGRDAEHERLVLYAPTEGADYPRTRRTARTCAFEKRPIARNAGPERAGGLYKYAPGRHLQCALTPHSGRLGGAAQFVLEICYAVRRGGRPRSMRTSRSRCSARRCLSSPPSMIRSLLLRAAKALVSALTHAVVTRTPAVARFSSTDPASARTSLVGTHCCIAWPGSDLGLVHDVGLVVGDGVDALVAGGLGDMHFQAHGLEQLADEVLELVPVHLQQVGPGVDAGQRVNGVGEAVFGLLNSMTGSTGSRS